MKELGRRTQKMLTTKDRLSELLTYITDVVQPEVTKRWKSINTHTHTHTHTHTRKYQKSVYSRMKLSRFCSPILLFVKNGPFLHF